MRGLRERLESRFVNGPLRGRDFRLLTMSTGLSSLGDELALIALTIKVADLTDSGWAVAGLLLCGWCRSWIFAPAAGVIVDNFETRRSFAIATAIQAGLAVGLAFTTELPMILMLSFLLGTASAVENPSIYTLVPRVVGDDHATEGNAYLEAARYTGMIAGPVLAGSIAAGVGTEGRAAGRRRHVRRDRRRRAAAPGAPSGCRGETLGGGRRP